MYLTNKNTVTFIFIIKKMLLVNNYCFFGRKPIYPQDRKTTPACDIGDIAPDPVSDLYIGEEADEMKIKLPDISSYRLIGVGVICGIAGVLPDLDHIPPRIMHMRINPIYLIPNFYTDKLQMGWGRPFHNLILVLAIATLLCVTMVLFQYNIRIFAARTVAACKATVAAAIADQ